MSTTRQEGERATPWPNRRVSAEFKSSPCSLVASRARQSLRLVLITIINIKLITIQALARARCLRRISKGTRWASVATSSETSLVRAHAETTQRSITVEMLRLSASRNL